MFQRCHSNRSHDPPGLFLSVFADSDIGLSITVQEAPGGQAGPDARGVVHTLGTSFSCPYERDALPWDRVRWSEWGHSRWELLGPARHSASSGGPGRPKSIDRIGKPQNRVDRKIAFCSFQNMKLENQAEYRQAKHFQHLLSTRHFLSTCEVRFLELWLSLKGLVFRGRKSMD